ncbi:MAG: hypothetical protein COB78_05850 [Hyphomicrobiales bacterium]|nr:MAG: hypothetical protein COB78_05850 [Hyphomicrobiales bacterium]
MRAQFVEVENVDRFLAGCEKVEHRGAPESSWHLVIGEPGFGKTRTLAWYYLQNDCLLIRAKAGWTPTWALRDVANELGLLAARSREKLYEQIVIAMAQNQRAIIVDEIDHALGDRRIIETFRDISDETEVPIIIGGMSGVEKRLKRYPQIYSRINSVTKFQACSVEDVQRCCDELCEVHLADDIAPLVLAHTGGRLREVINYIAELERIGKRSGELITADSLQGRILTNDGKSRTGVRAA